MTPSWLPSGGEIIGEHGGGCVERWNSILGLAEKKRKKRKVRIWDQELTRVRYHLEPQKSIIRKKKNTGQKRVTKKS
jgi:hypothetical protein